MAKKKTKKATKKKVKNKTAKKKKATKAARKKVTKNKTTKVAKKKAARKKPAAKKTAGKKTPAKAKKKAPKTRERVVPTIVVKRVKQPVPATTWPTEKEWRQSGLCSEAQADGIPCTALGRNCEICERADQKKNHGG